MDEIFSEQEAGIGNNHLLRTWVRVYLHGVIAVVALGLVAYLVSHLVPLFDFTGNRAVAVLVSVLVILAGPPLIGSLILFVVFPYIGKRQDWRALLTWDDRLFSEISSARSKARIVIIRWPSPQVRTMGVLTSMLADDGTGRQLAAVYVPTAPQTKLGYIRIVELDEIEFTDWTLRQWQLYQLTFGSVSPDLVRPDPDNG